MFSKFFLSLSAGKKIAFLAVFTALSVAVYHPYEQNHVHLFIVLFRGDLFRRGARLFRCVFGG